MKKASVHSPRQFFHSWGGLRGGVKAQYVQDPAVKKRIFWRNLKPPLQLQIIPKYDNLQGLTYTEF